MADYLGDSTAKDLGRLTLNPISHIDPFGTILLPLIFFLFSVLLPGQQTFIFAYAKPVPYNPYNLRDQKYGPAWIALAGPGVNLFLAIIFGLVIRFTPYSQLTNFFYLIVFANLLLFVINMIPLPPLDGAKIVSIFQPNYERYFSGFGFLLVLIFLFTIGFRLVFLIINLLFGLIVGQPLY